MRGLKPLMIEEGQPPFGRIFYRCVDWNHRIGIIFRRNSSRIFYRCVDWNHNYKLIVVICCKVASFTDAWIETHTSDEKRDPKKSHLLQMRGLKHVKVLVKLGREKGRIFYRCVDWNVPGRVFKLPKAVASFTDAWIETRELDQMFNPK